PGDGLKANEEPAFSALPAYSRISFSNLAAFSSVTQRLINSCSTPCNSGNSANKVCPPIDTTRSLRCPRTGFAEIPENPSEPPHFRPTESLESGAGCRSCLFISTSPRKVSRIAFDIREYSVPCWCSNKYKGLLNLGSRLRISS